MINVKMLKDVHEVRRGISKLPEDEMVDGVHLTTRFCTHFGYLGRNARHFLLMDGVGVGYYEEYVPWSFYKETQQSYILNVAIESCEGLDFSLEEDPYWDDVKRWFPCLDTAKEAVRVARRYFEHLKSK